jgi:uncharacterized membrane protein
MLALMLYSLFYLIYSAIGMLTFTLAIRPIAAIVRLWGGVLWLWALPLFILVAIGVYLGLILRFNSWDLLHRTGEIWAAVVQLVTHPRVFSITLAFAAFLWLAYLTIDTWIDGVLLRRQQRREKEKRPEIPGVE